MNAIDAMRSGRPFKRQSWNGFWIDPEAAKTHKFSRDDIIASDWIIETCDHQPSKPIQDLNDWTLANARCTKCGQALVSELSFKEWKEVPVDSYTLKVLKEMEKPGVIHVRNP